MAYRFGLETDDSWAEEISEITSDPAFQNAEIRIIDQSLLTVNEYNEDTGVRTIEGDPLVYLGRARIIPVRWGTLSGGESQANSTTLNALRVQIPRVGESSAFYGLGLFGVGPYGYGAAAGSDGRVRKNSKVIVVSCPRNTSLVNRVFTITSDLQGSMSATRTFEAMSDIDAVMPDA